MKKKTPIPIPDGAATPINSVGAQPQSEGMPNGPSRKQIRRKRCFICKELMAGEIYKFNGPRTYACKQCLRHYYESQDRERWSTPEEFDRFFEDELRNRAIRSTGSVTLDVQDRAHLSTDMQFDGEKIVDRIETLPARDPIGTYFRESRAARRVGVDAQCTHCGEARPEALIAHTNPKICAACDRKIKGQATLDHHHAFGQNNNPATVPVPVNDHRAELSVAQHRWPKETRENPDGSPLLAASACVRGFIDTMTYLIKKGLLWIAEALECIEAYLVEQWGRRWWVGTPIERFAVKK